MNSAPPTQSSMQRRLLRWAPFVTALLTASQLAVLKERWSGHSCVAAWPEVASHGTPVFRASALSICAGHLRWASALVWGWGLGPYLSDLAGGLCPPGLRTQQGL